MKMTTPAKAGSSRMESPKTPGGISKSLLTPCRRVGLSRKWRGSGVSPFISPLGQNDFGKRINESENETCSENATNSTEYIETTPSRPVRKKSKVLQKTLRSNSKSSIVTLDLSEDSSHHINDETNIPSLDTAMTDTETLKETPIDNTFIEEIEDTLPENSKIQGNTKVLKLTRKKSLKKSPINLTKECMVVIDREILNKNSNISKSIFDSESENTPLSHISKLKDKENTDTTLDDNEFVVTLQKKKSDKKASSGDLRKRHNLNNTQISSQILTIPEHDDDNDFIDTKKTILLRKTYIKPTRAKSTGSITQRDLEDIKNRIERKKELLLAKSFSEDTAELQELIKKWRKGCQDALSELMDLMRKKFPEKYNMDYSELLEMLKIPSNIVGYDSEHDVFKSPHDFNIFGF